MGNALRAALVYVHITRCTHQKPSIDQSKDKETKQDTYFSLYVFCKLKKWRAKFKTNESNSIWKSHLNSIEIHRALFILCKYYVDRCARKILLTCDANSDGPSRPFISILYSIYYYYYYVRRWWVSVCVNCGRVSYLHISFPDGGHRREESHNGRRMSGCCTCTAWIYVSSGNPRETRNKKNWNKLYNRWKALNNSFRKRIQYTFNVFTVSCLGNSRTPLSFGVFLLWLDTHSNGKGRKVSSFSFRLDSPSPFVEGSREKKNRSAAKVRITNKDASISLFFVFFNPSVECPALFHFLLFCLFFVF